MSNRRILIFSLAYYPLVGGAEIAVKEITNRIPEIEWDMVTLSFDKAHKKIEKVGNVNIYRISSSKTLFPMKAFFFTRVLADRQNYNAIWAIMANRAGLAALLYKMALPTTPYILTLQEGDSLEYIKHKTRLIGPLFKMIFTRADKIQAISNFLASWARQMGYQKEIELIPNGVDLNKFTINNKQFTRNTENITLITTSRLVEKNGVGDIIDAIKLLPENICLQIIGSGPLEENLKFKIKNLKLENRVEMLGEIPNSDISLFLNKADIFVRPSLSEGQGISFIEAMAAGLPIIATPVGGIPDFLKDPSTSSGQVATGLFCEVNNPKSIADKVMEYINNQDLTRKIVDNARKMVEEKYDWDLIAKEMKGRVFDKV